MMASESKPKATTSLGDLQLGPSYSKDPAQTDFTCCIICQSDSGKQHNVTKQSIVTLKTATNARQDEVWERLSADLESETFIEDNKPKWHPKCRNIYLLKSSYERAEKKRTDGSRNQSMITEDRITPRESSQTRRSMFPKFDSKTQCVICCKTYHDHKKPTSLVTTNDRQNSLHRKAKELDDQALLTRIQGFGDQAIDMVAYDVCYHRVCMNRYMSQRSLNRRSLDTSDMNHETFSAFVKKINDPIFKHSAVFLLTTLRDMYRSMLQDNGIPNWESYRSSSLKNRLQMYFQDRIVFFPQAKGSDVICSSSLPIGDVLMKLKQLQDESIKQDDQNIVLNAARILRDSAKSLKSTLTQTLDDLLNVSSDAAKQLVPETLYMFTRQLLVDKKLHVSDSELSVDNADNKALLLAQQLLYSMCNIRTPLSIGLAFDIYNETRSKTQMTKMNRLQQSISYDSFHRILTSVYNNVIAIKEEKGIYVPPNMRHGVFTHFAMDNIDWNEKTADGSTYHATSAVMIQPPTIDNAQDDTDQQAITGHRNVEQPVSRKRTIDEIETDPIQPCRLTPGDRKKSRCLSEIADMESLMTTGPKVGNQLLFLWGLGRMTPTQILDLELDDSLPGFSAFCAQVNKAHQANEIGYLPLIPSSPTDPGVVKTSMTNLAKMAETIGMTHTIITCDQAVFEIAFAIRKQYPEEFPNVILMLGGFHLAHNYLKAITKIMRGSGAEDILVAAEVLLPGTANKSFGPNSDYYQSLHALTILYEVMLSLYWESFENWSIKQNKDTSCIASLSNVIQKLSNIDFDDDLSEILDKTRPHLDDSKKLGMEFREAMHDHPTHNLWSTFLDMMEILLSFVCSQREGNWIDYLDQAGNMLPYLVAAGHHKYGVYLSLHLKEMRNLQEAAPDVLANFLRGEFTVRRTRGRHNGVSPDMILEQTYNAEVKQKQRLCGITLTPKAQTKWLYTKPITAAIAGKLKRMLKLDPIPEITSPHHEAGASQVKKDLLAVQRGLQVVATKMVNPFQDPATHELICISTGVRASQETQKDLCHVKEIGEKALKTCLDKGGDKLSVKLHTFDTTPSKKSTEKVHRKVGPEINLLQRVSQVIAAGGEVHLHELVGEHECTRIPPSLFDSEGCLRQGNKSTLLKVLLEDSKVKNMNHLPVQNTNTAVVIDAMYAIHRWSFRPGETFKDVAIRYQQNILQNIPPETSSIHFCCDRYDHVPSLKAMERKRRGNQNLRKLYDIQSHFPTPAFRDFVSVEENKAALMCFLSQTWSGPRSNSPVPLYLSGGFTDETTTMMVDDHGATEIPALSSTHEEADTRMILHILYSAEILNASRIVVHTNDTDVVILCIYYCAKTPSVKELWVRTDSDSYVPVHQIAACLGKNKCLTLPYFHAFSGKDDTSFIYGLGKKKLWKSLAFINAEPLQLFAEDPDSQNVTEDLIASCRALVIKASSGNENDTLADLRMRKFLVGKSGLLLNLPPTDDSLEQHVKRAALATIISKSAHIPKPGSIDVTSYGWLLHGNNMIKPVYMTKNAFPANLETCVKCMCKRRCAGNCACSKNNVPCYGGCYCQGKSPTCSRAVYLDPEESDSE